MNSENFDYSKINDSANVGGETTIEQMREGDVGAGLRLSSMAGWNQLIADWQMFYELNPNGAFVAKYNGQVVGTVTTTDYNNKVGWIAMVLVDPAFRHRGIATRLVKRALEALSHLETVKLDATPAGERVYSRMGFKGEFCLTRMAGEIEPASDRSICTGKVRVMTERHIESVISLDAEALGAERSAAIEGLLKIAPEYAIILEHKGKIRGFLMGRHGSQFEFAGPLIAHDIDTAKHLLDAFAERNSGVPIAMDIPDLAAEWQGYLKEIGMKAQRPFIRMFRGREPRCGETGLIFSTAGPELG